MSKAALGDVLTAMVTPFDADLKVDYDKAATLAERLMDSGSDGLVVCGTTGESPTLTREEKLQLFRVTKAAIDDRGKIIAGTGNYCTADSVALTKEADDAGADGFLLVCPYYNKPPQEGLYQHFKAVAAATEKPCILYNIPSRTGRNIEAKTTIRLSEIDNIVGIKEASGDFDMAAEVRAGTASSFCLWSGDDSATIHLLSSGGCGVISVASHVIGSEIKQLIDAYHSGNVATAVELHLQWMPVFKALFIPTSVNPAPVKAALQLTGFDVGGLRLPLVPVTEQEKAHIRFVLENSGVLH